MGQRSFPQWQPGYSVGNWVLDNQHKKLLILCQQAIDCRSEAGDEGNFRFRILLNDLLDYADEHVRTEESLLRNCGFPQFERHQEEHAAYRRQLGDFLNAAGAGEIDKAGLNHYLAHWWSAHILGSDKQYSGYIQRVR